jgi:hypothetical protein
MPRVLSVTGPLNEPDRYRRQQRRRAFIGWGSGLTAIVLIALGAIFSDGDQQRRETVLVPYGETMTSTEYGAIGENEDQAEVLQRLGKSGRPESLTEGYVLVLFPPHSEDVSCSYWEFSDEPQIFARLCFDSSDGHLVQKLERNVHEGIERGEGTISA